MNVPLVLVTPDYPPHYGGVARYLSGLVKASQGQIRVIVSHDHPSRVSLVALMIRLRKELVLVSHVLPFGTAAWFASWFGGSGYVVIVHGLDLRLAQKMWRKRWIARRVLRGARLIVANSEFVAQEITRVYPECTSLVITPAIEPATMPSRIEARQTLGIAEQEIVLLSVCRLVKRKGVDRMIATLAHLPSSVTLTIIGRGPELAALRALSASFGGRIRFLTNASDEEKQQWYAAADVFALPVREDRDDPEGFGMVFLEAAYAGLPVVGGVSGGMSEAIQDGVTGFLVSDDAMLLNRLTRLIEDPTLRTRMGLAGQARVARAFIWPERWERLSRAISSL